MTLADTYVTWTGWAAQVVGIVFFTLFYGGTLALAWRVAGRPPARRPLLWCVAAVVCVVLTWTLEGAAVVLFLFASFVLWLAAIVSLRRVARAAQGT